jgi:hypothetical protein
VIFGSFSGMLECNKKENEPEIPDSFSVVMKAQTETISS